MTSIGIDDLLSPGQDIDWDRFLEEHADGEASLNSWLQMVHAEDLGKAGDVTTMATVPAGVQAVARFLVKKDGILAGVRAAQWIVREFTALFTSGASCAVHFEMSDGQIVRRGQHIGTLTGDAHLILQIERTALNVMQRMSGIATQTNRMVTIASKAAAGSGVPPPTILDTRKTVPGMRILDKMAVRIGGGGNHRFGLYDMVLIKDNHVAAAGSVSKAIQNCRDYLKTHNLEHLQIECEVETLEQVQELIDINLLRPTDRVMLDNMVVRTGNPDSPFQLDTLKAALALLLGKYQVEVSGNISEDSIAAIVRAAPGLTFMSSGSLTHSVTALDISLNIEM